MCFFTGLKAMEALYEQPKKGIDQIPALIPWDRKGVDEMPDLVPWDAEPQKLIMIPCDQNDLKTQCCASLFKLNPQSFGELLRKKSSTVPSELIAFLADTAFRLMNPEKLIQCCVGFPISLYPHIALKTICDDAMVEKKSKKTGGIKHQARIIYTQRKAILKSLMKKIPLENEFEAKALSFLNAATSSTANIRPVLSSYIE